jgi:hypothetical protein
MQAIAMARAALIKLKATGESGFEGLVCRLLTTHLGLELILTAGGWQSGCDMGAGPVAGEAKRYDRRRLDIRELAGEMAIAKQSSPELMTWIVAATRGCHNRASKRLTRLRANCGST